MTLDPRLSSALSDRYRLERELGGGGMARVYLAEETALKRTVVLKVVAPELAAGLSAERFAREVRVAAALQQANIVPVLTAGEADGLPFYVMPYVEGRSLRERMTAGAPSIGEALDILRDVARALSYAHARGIVHRDIKPENILLSGGTAVVTDFGIAKAISAARTEERATDETLTQAGHSIGTPAYMAPEQAIGAAVDQRADLYAWGVVAYELLSGHHPFQARTGTQQLIAAHLTETPTPLPSPVPAAVATLVQQCLAKDAAARPANADELLSRLASVATLSDERRVATSNAGRRWRWRWPAAAAIVVVIASGWLVRRHQQTGGAEDAARRVIAVLPFRNISQDTAQQYFSAGMTEEIATQLSRIASLRVLGRSATEPYDGRSDRLQRMAADLHVGSVVEGSVRLAGNQVRIGVELTDARTGQSLWSEQYDRTIDSVFAVQGDVAKKVTFALQATLTPAESTRVGRVTTTNPAAHQLYLRAMAYNPLLRSGNRDMTALLKQAVEADSTFALAWATLARIYMFRGVGGEPVWVDSAFGAARKAIAVDSNESEGWFALGDLLVQPEKYSDARRAYLRALELRPGHSGAMADLANVYVALGRFDEALDWALKAQQLNPSQAHGFYHAGLPLLAMADDSATERFLLRGLQQFPNQSRIVGLQVWLDLRRGENEKATARAKALVRDNPDNTEMPPIRAEAAVVVNGPDALALIEPLARQAPVAQGQMFTESLRSMYALELQRAGKVNEAVALWAASAAAAERALKEGHEGYAQSMELAAIHAIQGQTTEALDWLDKGYRGGFKDYVILDLDPFFRSLHQEPRYQAVVAQMKQDVAEMRGRAAAAHPEIFVAH